MITVCPVPPTKDHNRVSFTATCDQCSEDLVAGGQPVTQWRIDADSLGAVILGHLTSDGRCALREKP